MRLDLSSKPGLEETRERGQELAEFAKEQLELLLKRRAELHKVVASTSAEGEGQ
ncbi:MAG: hypothetical protein H8E47_02510 [Anaerolineales bacterium]|nr:hypothetical protein [Anaerolineales bacterium]